MDIDDFMRMDTPVQRRTVRASFLNAYRPSERVNEPPLKREKIGNEFAQSLNEEMDRKLQQNYLQKKQSHFSNLSLDDIEDDRDGACSSSGQSTSNSKYMEQRNIYTRYKFNNQPFNARLPIFRFKETIQRRVREKPVLVIKGETGCGKSTQVPQFMLDDAFNRNEYCNIVVTQPRRIAALSLAEQVARERQCELSTLVGCQIGLDRRMSEDTRLLYCTTGVLLQKLVKAKHMRMYTHIVLDEIHERDEEMEFLLITIKRFMINDPFSTKIILMSATIDTDEFSHYFRLPLKDAGWSLAPSIDLEHGREFQVKQHYLEELQPLQRQTKIDYENPGIDQSMYQLACKVVEIFSRPEVDGRGSCMLVFLPGIHEIVQMQRLLAAEKERLKRSSQKQLLEWNVMALHSTISSDDQRACFIRAAPNTVKVILATNIAESSITVPDVKYVIDFCLTRCMEVDQETGFARLRLKWASKNSCKQRAGRTGRTSNGECFRLINRDFFEQELHESEVSAMKRCSLEKIVLKAKMLDENEAPAKIIGLAISPPDLSDITYTVMNLKEARGLHFNVGHKYVEDDGDLTFIGYVMDALPLDFRASRLIVLGYIFNVLEECIIIAAGITVQRVFTMNINDPMRTYNNKLTFADGSGSDLIAILNAYQYYLRKIYDNHYHEDEIRTQAFERYSLDPRGLNEMYHLINEIHLRLEPFNLKPAEGVHKMHLSPRDKNIVLKVCIAGAFYPNFFLRSSSIAREDSERRMYHDLNGRDPCNTIYYKGLGYDDMGILYQNQVKAYLRDRNVISSVDDVKISFDKNSPKMYVTFLGKQQLIDSGATEEKPFSDWVPGKVCTQIYKALKLKRERYTLKLKVMDKRDMMRYAHEIGAGRYENGVFIPLNTNIKHEDLCCLPDVYCKTIIGRVSCIITPNKFWIRPLDTRNEHIQMAIRRCLNNCPSTLAPLTEMSELKGKLVAVFVRNEEARANNLPRMYHRARIITSLLQEGQHLYQVNLIDEGEEAIVDVMQICSLDGVWIRGRELGLADNNKIYVVDIPPRVFEASLAEIRPSYVTSSAGKWTPDAVDRFKNLISRQDEFNIEVYSIWNGVASVILYDNRKNSINKMLVMEQLAQTCEESYQSKQDHATRFYSQNFLKKELEVGQNAPATQEILDFLKDFYMKQHKPPPERLCTQTLTLRGPVSPLETTIHSTMRSAAKKTHSIDRLSVNNILLDTDPQDPTERLIVAASVASNSHRNELTLRNSTIMPNIHGFAQLMAMLFAPHVELHRDVSQTRYSSLLAGLGFKLRKKLPMPLYPEHDVVLRFDCFMDTEDMKNINKLRYTMSALLNVSPGEKVPDLRSDDILRLKKDANMTLIRFLQKDRKFIDERTHETDDHKWGSVKEEELQIVEGTQVYGERAIFPSFTFLVLQPEAPEEINRFRDNNQELYAIAFCNASMPSQVDCLLCSKTMTTRPEIRTHLFTKLHKDRAEQCHAKFQVQQYQPEHDRSF